MTTDELMFREDFFIGIEKKRYFNSQISAMYNQIATDYWDEDRKALSSEIEGLENRADRITRCMLDWKIDSYVKSKAKVINEVYRCGDKFCYNCQSLLALQRFYQYRPVLDGLAKDYEIFHVIITQPNVTGERLKATLDLMFDRFHYLIGYFNGHKKIKGLDFKKYGFEGAVRSLEVTQNRASKLYHPHFHCLFVLKKDLSQTEDFRPWCYNSFSENYARAGRKEERLFTTFEVLLQRIWCLLLMREKVTLENIERLDEIVPRYPDGFSVVVNAANGQYHEIFKYATKGAFKDGTIDDYKAFCTLYDVLFNRRIYQTYGCLLGYDFNEVDETLGLNDKTDQTFNEFLKSLRAKEMPQVLDEQLGDIVENVKAGQKYYSKTVFRKRIEEHIEKD